MLSNVPVPQQAFQPPGRGYGVVAKYTTDLAFAAGWQYMTYNDRSEWDTLGSPWTDHLGDTAVHATWASGANWGGWLTIPTSGLWLVHASWQTVWAAAAGAGAAMIPGLYSDNPGGEYRGQRTGISGMTACELQFSMLRYLPAGMKIIPAIYSNVAHTSQYQPWSTLANGNRFSAFLVSS